MLEDVLQIAENVSLDVQYEWVVGCSGIGSASDLTLTAVLRY